MNWDLTFEMAALSLASYDDDSDAIKEWYDHTLFVKHPRTGTEAYAVAGNGYRAIAVRGSDALTDWLWNFFLCRRKDGAHKGFSEGSDSILENMALLEFLEEHKDEGSILLTGHSRGGSIAQILVTELDEVAACWCFGAPRVGNRAFKRSYFKNGVPTYLFRNKGDVVPSLLPWWWGYTHVTNIRSMDGHGHDMGEYLEEAAKKAGYR